MRFSLQDQVAKDFEERLRVQEEKKKQKIEKLKQESMPTFKPAKKRVVVAVDDEGNEIGDVWRAGGGSARLKVKTVGAASKPSWVRGAKPWSWLLAVWHTNWCSCVGRCQR